MNSLSCISARNYSGKSSNGFLNTTAKPGGDVYPFHSLKPGRTINFDDYRFGGSNGQEADDEIMGTGDINTAEFWQYDSRLGRRWNRDPKRNPSISEYAAFANNPVWYSDQNGDTIKIAYKTKKGIGRLFERNKYIIYTPGMEYNGDNQFVQDAVNSLNFIYENNADIHGIIESVVVHEEVVKVKKGRKDQYFFDEQIIIWSTKGMKVKHYGNKTKSGQSGALGLFHEVGHAYRHFYMLEDSKNHIDILDDQYDNLEERRVIEDYETPAAEILKNTGFDEGIRDNHSGFKLNTEKPTSTKTKREARRLKSSE